MSIEKKYLNLITSQHRDKSNYIQTVTELLRPLADVFEMAIYFDDDFDIDNAIGVQLDILGDILDRSRYLYVEITDRYFTWNAEGVGWEQGVWKEADDPIAEIRSLEDELYRRVLKAKVMSNHWDGTIDNARTLYDVVFGDLGAKVVIQDNLDMSMTVGLVGLPNTAVHRSLLALGHLFVKPAGVRINYYLYSENPEEKLFAWDAASDRLAGWDEGHWGIELKVQGGNEYGY